MAGHLEVSHQKSPDKREQRSKFSMVANREWKTEQECIHIWTQAPENIYHRD